MQALETCHVHKKMAAFFNNPILLSGLNSIIGNQCLSKSPSDSCKGCNLLFVVCFTKLYIIAIKTISSSVLLFKRETLYFKIKKVKYFPKFFALILENI